MRKCHVIGMDVVEVAPPYDSSDITSQLAAKLIIDVLAERFSSR